MRRRSSFSMMLLILSTMLTALVFVEHIHAQDWLANAQIEKKLVLYHSPNVPDTQNILTGFRKKYPFIEVETYRASGEKLLQKITMEARAGRISPMPTCSADFKRGCSKPWDCSYPTHRQNERRFLRR